MNKVVAKMRVMVPKISGVPVKVLTPTPEDNEAIMLL